MPARSRSTDGKKRASGGALSRLPGEARLLLASAGGPDQDAELRRLLAGEIDWLKLCRLAVREQAVAILSRRLAELGGAPDPVVAPLRNLAMVSEGRLLLLRRRLLEALDALNTAGIDAVLLKGAGVAHTAYAEFRSRPMSDIDLLVDPSRAVEAQRVLLAAAWQRSSRAGRDAAYDSHQHLPPLEDAAGSGIGLEVHAELFPGGRPFDFTPSMIRDCASPVVLDGRPALVPMPAHQLLHACLHFAWTHGMSGAGWRTFRDIAAISAAGGIDWDGFVRLAHEARGATCCYWTFRLAYRTAGIEVPESVLAALRPPRPEPVLRRIERHFILGLLPTSSACPSVRVTRFMWRAGVLPGRSGHRDVLPWDRDELFQSRDADLAGDVRPASVVRHARLIRGWGRYIRQLA